MEDPKAFRDHRPRWFSPYLSTSCFRIASLVGFEVGSSYFRKIKLMPPAPTMAHGPHHQLLARKDDQAVYLSNLQHLAAQKGQISDSFWL